MKKPYLIAEIGVNFYDTAKAEHITPMEAAKKYIIAAKMSGVDAVKFQSYKAGALVSKNSPAYWDLSKEPTATQYELFKKHDSFCEQEYRELANFCKEMHVDFMSTPFDYNSADYLSEIIDSYKISSSDLSNLPFLKYIATKKKPIILSVGASYLYEVDEAVRVILECGCPKLSILHCILSYPCKYEDANLNTISYLKRIYPELIIGYSDHTMPDPCMSVISAAYLLGAEIIEKHFTLNKALPGNDHYHSGDPDDFRKIKENFNILGQVLGEEKKTVFECELVPRKEARRSLVLVRDMKKGEVLTENDLIAKRPGTGISPKYIDIVLGKGLINDTTEDTILTWEMI